MRRRRKERLRGLGSNLVLRHVEIRGKVLSTSAGCLVLSNGIYRRLSGETPARMARELHLSNYGRVAASYLV